MNKRISQKTTLDFNKEILVGEAGALVSAPLIAYITSIFFESPKVISFSAVIGAIVGASIFWLAMRAHDKRVRGHVSVDRLANDVMYFTPAAFLITLMVYYPALFFASKYLISGDHRVLYSVVFSQIFAFSMFLIAINIYRYALAKLAGKVL